jgi:putative Holliday junction resolvase
MIIHYQKFSCKNQCKKQYKKSVQEKETTNRNDFTDVFHAPAEGRIIALDIGTKRVGVAVCDELQITVRPLFTLKRAGWKKLLLQIKDVLAEFDARALVLGLPYNFDGSESEMSAEARRVARNFSLSLAVPVFLQDERMSSYDARGNLWKQGADYKEMRDKVDSQAAAIILSDFLSRIPRK